MDKTEALAIIKCLQKKDMTPEDILALLQDPPNSPGSGPSDFYLVLKIKSHVPGRQFGNNPCCRGVAWGPGCNRRP